MLSALSSEEPQQTWKEIHNVIPSGEEGKNSNDYLNKTREGIIF